MKRQPSLALRSRRAVRRTGFALGALVLLALVAGCGQKGPLSLSTAAPIAAPAASGAAR